MTRNKWRELMSQRIVIQKRKWYGKLVTIKEYNASVFELVVSTGGVLTVRHFNSRKSELALNANEWSKAEVV